MIFASEFLKYLAIFGVSYSGGPPPTGALLAVNNLSDVANRTTSVQNLGFGSQSKLTLVDANFTTGVYQLTNPCPAIIDVNVVGSGLVIRLPTAQGIPTYSPYGLMQGPLINVLSGSQSVAITDSASASVNTISASTFVKYTLLTNGTSAGTWQYFTTGSGGGGGGAVDTGTINQVATYAVDGTTVSGVSYLQDASSVMSFDWMNRLAYDATANESLNWTSRELTDTTALTSVNWQQRAGYWIDGLTEVLNWQYLQAYDEDGMLSYDWNARTLYDDVSGGKLSLSWEVRQLYASDGTTINVDWSTAGGTIVNGVAVTGTPSVGYVPTATSATTATWQPAGGGGGGVNPGLINQAAVYASAGSTVSGTYQFLDSTSAISIDYNARQAYWTDGTTVLIDWSYTGGTNLNLNDVSGATAIQWNYRAALWTDGETEVLNWQYLQGYDEDGTLAYDWNARALFDIQGGGTIAVAWASRQLLATDGTTINVDWSTAGSTIVNGVAVTGTPSVGYVPTATSSSTATWQAAGGGSSFAWTDVTGTTQALAVNNGYIADNAGLVTMTLPASAAQGTLISISGNGAGGWLIAQNSGQNINLGDVSTTAGAGGSLASTNRYDQVDLLCTVANTTWVARNMVGNITYV
jgi:hypothetical protein